MLSCLVAGSASQRFPLHLFGHFQFDLDECVVFSSRYEVLYPCPHLM